MYRSGYALPTPSGCVQALRLTNINPTKAQSEAEAALAAGVMQSEDDNAMVRITATGDMAWGHPLYMISQWAGFVMRLRYGEHPQA